jgi:hypothetical protein
MRRENIQSILDTIHRRVNYLLEQPEHGNVFWGPALGALLRSIYRTRGKLLPDLAHNVSESVDQLVSTLHLALSCIRYQGFNDDRNSITLLRESRRIPSEQYRQYMRQQRQRTGLLEPEINED